MPIRFFYEEVEFKLPHPLKIKQWVSLSAKKERRKIGELNYIFCSDSYLLRLNRKYLYHRSLTDIITFDWSVQNTISGEIYISIDRVAENAHEFESDFMTELKRVMVHGVMHICGFKDKSQSEKILMRKKEDAYLSLWKKLFHVKRSA
jgi:rRNA maturation RNase YbeY